MSFKKVFKRNELHEVVNIAVLKEIVKNWDKYESRIVKNNENDYDYNPKNICQKYLTLYNKTTAIMYSKSSKYASKLGRWFCRKGIGIQSMPRVIRHTICEGLYIDLDFKNAHPKILQSLCLKNNINCDFLTKYIDNRDSLLVEWGSLLNHTKEEVKAILLCALNGNKTKYIIPAWDKILEEFKNIHKSIVALPVYETIVKEVEDIERTNIHAKIVNRILCTIENECLESLYKTLDKKGLLNVVIDDCNYKVCSLIFDGLQIPLNTETENYCTPENFKTLSSIIENETGFSLEIAQKPFHDKLDIPLDIEDEEDDADVIIDNDGDAAEHIVAKFGDNMINCNNVRYVKNGNIWTCDEKILKAILFGWIFKTSLKRWAGLRYVFYNRDKSSINKCVDVLHENWCNFVPNNPTFVSNMLIHAKEYLPFLNGVYSMRQKKLLRYEDVSVQFNQVIDRDFPQFDADTLDTLMKKIIIPILPYEEERKYFLYCISRALAGKYEDKKWFINKGSRNSGKGVITKLLQNAFKLFVGTFNSGSLTRKQHENADDAKNLSWVVRKKDHRLLISQEVQEDVILNGKMLKQLASGGDTMLGRCNYQDETEFTPQFTMMLNCNELKGVEPVDAYESCEQFYCKSKFVTQDELIEGQPFLKLKDENIKTLLENKGIIDAFTIYVLDHFADSMVTPDSVKFSTQDMLQDIPENLENIVLKNFRHSKNNNDKMFTDDIIEKIRETDYDGCVGTKEVQTIILKCGVGCRTGNGNVRIGGIQKKGYTNITFIP